MKSSKGTKELLQKEVMVQVENWYKQLKMGTAPDNEVESSKLRHSCPDKIFDAVTLEAP